MAKESKTADQLADMISGRIGVSGVGSGSARTTPTAGVRPSSQRRATSSAFQRRAEEIARLLRLDFDLAS